MGTVSADKNFILLRAVNAPLKAGGNASVVKLVDTMDSKSIAFTGVAVRVRPLVPLFLIS